MKCNLYEKWKYRWLAQFTRFKLCIYLFNEKYINKIQNDIYLRASRNKFLYIYNFHQKVAIDILCHYNCCYTLYCNRYWDFCLFFTICLYIIFSPFSSFSFNFFYSYTLSPAFSLSSLFCFFLFYFFISFLLFYFFYFF